MGLNSGGQLHEPLDLIYPSEGIVTADYPFMLLNDAKRDAYDKVVAWLRTPDVQRRIMTDTARRPSIPGVPLDSRFPTQTLVELPFPSKLDTIDALLTVYLDQIRRPASAVFVLDNSGSMQGERLDSLKQALNQLTGTDTSLTGQFSRFRTREEITLLTFSSFVDQPQTFTIDDANPNSPDMQQIRDAVDAMEAGGGTAIYSALAQAYDIVQSEQASDPNRLWSIVLMTDGENNDGISPDTWRAEYQALPQDVQNVHTYPILFGDSSQDEMQSIADTTGGRLFDAQSSDLETIFKQIRGYQ
jgi:Ca-activated chloride channel family protein